MLSEAMKNSRSHCPEAGDSEAKARPSILIKALAYTAPQLGVALLLGPIITVLGGIYAKHFGLALTTIAAVMLVARIFDAVTDPLIGYYSDRWRARTGTRKPFILAGCLLLIPSSFCLFVPPDGVGGIYFTFWYMAFYLAFTIFVIPYVAWANEFTETSKEKTLVFSVLAAVGQGGNALFYVIPLLPFWLTTEITPEVLRFTVLMGVSLLIPGLYLAIKIVPDGPAPRSIPMDNSSASSASSGLKNCRLLIAAFVKNQPFLLYVSAYLCLGIGYGMWAGLFFIYVDVYLQLGEIFAKLTLWGILIGIGSIPAWYRLSLYWGKRTAWLVGMALLAAVFLGTGMLRPIHTGLGELFALNILLYFAAGSLGVIAQPVLCDVIDYGRFKEGTERNAQYFAIHALMTKLQMAIGGALGFAIVGWFGFDVQASQQSDLSLLGLRISISWLPTLFVILAMIFIAKMPLSEKRMEIIRRRLKARDERAGP